MNSARDLLRSYMEILSEAPVTPAPTPKAGLAQPPADGASRPTAPPAGAAPPAQEPQYSPQVARPQKVGTTQYGSDPVAQPEEPRSYGPGAATGSWGTTVDGPGGSSSKVNPSTGEKTVGDESGSVKTDASGTPISYSPPSLGGMSSTTYTGSAGKGPASGAQTRGFNAGDVGVNQELDAAGKQTSQDTRYTMGATTINSKQGAAGTPQTFSATVDKRAFDNDQDMAAAQGEADKFAQQQQVKANQGQPVQEEDTHEHPESARHLLKKLLKLLKDEDKVDEDLTPTDPKEVGAKMNEPYISPAARANDKPNPAANAPEPKKIDAKTTAVPDAQFEEKKIEESLMHLYKAIKEGRIQ